LLSSIFDGRYKEQKYRLKNSGFTNIYYLFEGHLTGVNAMSEREVASALLKTRVKDQFKVVQVKSITESVKFLSFLT
jgi:crossover junction endonuclease MUS81